MLLRLKTKTKKFFGPNLLMFVNLAPLNDGELKEGNLHHENAAVEDDFQSL